MADLTGSNPVTNALVAGNALNQKIDAGGGIVLHLRRHPRPSHHGHRRQPDRADRDHRGAGTGGQQLRLAEERQYRMINPRELDPKWRAHVLQVNAAALTVTDQDAVSGP